MKPRVKGVYFFTALLLSLSIIYVTYESVIDHCLLQIREDSALISYALREGRRATQSRIFLLGGSNVREAYDKEKLNDWGKSKGYQLVKLGHSSMNVIEEQLIMMDAIDLRPGDHVFFEVFPTTLNRNYAPKVASLFEEPLHYFDRTQRQTKLLSFDRFFELVLAHFFEPFAQRQHLYKCINSNNTEDKTFKWSYRYLGLKKHPQYFIEQIAQYSRTSLNHGMSLDETQGRLAALHRLKTELGKQVHFYELPRNSLYAKIIDASYFDQHYKKMETLGLVRIDKYMQLRKQDFFDFNHLNASGRTKFTKAMLNYIETVVTRKDL